MKVIKGPELTEPADAAQFTDESLFLHRRRDGQTGQALVIFIHGLGGSRYGTWQNFPAYLYQDCPGVDVGLYAYRTAWRRLRPGKSIDLDDEGVVLAGILRDSTAGYRKVILVAHSMGGILSKVAVKNLIEHNDRDTLSRLGGLFLMATPQIGSLWVPSILPWFSRDMQVLRPHSRLVSAVTQIFTDRVACDLDMTAVDKFTIPVWAVLAAEDIWVSKLSAGLAIPAKQRKVVRGSHRQIVKPETKESDAYKWVLGHIRAMVHGSAPAPSPSVFVQTGGEIEDLDVFVAPPTLGGLKFVRERLADMRADPGLRSRGLGPDRCFSAAMANVRALLADVAPETEAPRMDGLSAALATFCAKMHDCVTQRIGDDGQMDCSEAELALFKSPEAVHDVMLAADDFGNRTLDALWSELCSESADAGGFAIGKPSCCCIMRHTQGCSSTSVAMLTVGFLELPFGLLVEPDAYLWGLHFIGRLFWSFVLHDLALNSAFEAQWNNLPDHVGRRLPIVLDHYVAVSIGVEASLWAERDGTAAVLAQTSGLALAPRDRVDSTIGLTLNLALVTALQNIAEAGGGTDAFLVEVRALMTNESAEESERDDAVEFLVELSKLVDCDRRFADTLRAVHILGSARGCQPLVRQYKNAVAAARVAKK